MYQQWQTVAIPFASGIKPVSRARTLDQTKLLTAQNCFFDKDEGPQKRFGHVSREVKTNDPVIGLNGIEPPASVPYRAAFSLANPGISDSWLHGWGLLSDTDLSTAGTYAKSAQPQVGNLHSQFARDSETVVWDGFRLLSKPASNTSQFGEVTGEAVIPAFRGEPIAKSLNGQTLSDAADSGVTRTVAWVYDGDVYRSVYNSTTGTCLVNEELLSGFTEALAIRVLTMGPWTHVVVQDDDTEVFLRSWHQDTPGTVISRSKGAVTESVFDVKKISETQAILARIDTSIEITLFNAEGNSTSTWSADGPTSPSNVAVAAHHSGVAGLLWQESGTSEVQFRSYSTSSGVTISAVVDVATLAGPGRITLADNYLLAQDPSDSSIYATCWTVYLEDTASTKELVKVYSVVESAVLKTTRYNTTLASHAFRVGQRTYVWCGVDPLFVLQPTWFLCDEKLLPVGKVCFGLAYGPDTTLTLNMPSVNWHTEDADHPAKDRFVFSGSLGYRQRANTEDESPDPNGVWLEPSVFFYRLDFLQPLRTAQAGRATYIAGAQLWEYDGASLNEANFHLTTESVTVADGGVGALDETKQYYWRIDLCYKNAQNEEIRSWSKVIEGPAPGESLFKATLTIPHMPMTRRDNSYFLIFRTEGNGTEYYLVSDRNPANTTGDNCFVFNSRGSATYSFSDNMSDDDLIEQEYHPSNATGWLHPFSAPACETIAAGRDRLWVAGGELSPGEVAPSRYFTPKEVPAFTPALNVQIDRNSEPITALGFVGETGVVFRRTSTYTFESDGPDNVNQGVWGFPRLAMADVGAVSQETVALAGEGLYFQSPAGIRVITPGGGLRPPGAGLVGGLGTDVDTLAAVGTYAAAVVVPKYSQVRWYSRDDSKPSIVVDYTKNVWTTWTGLTAVGATYSPALDAVVVARGDGFVWTEEEGRYLDGDRTYEMVVRTAWFHGGALGDFQRVRRWALFGEASTGLNLRYRLFYDERPFHTEEGNIAFNGDENTSEWGDGTWGSGSWGDSSNPAGLSGLWFRDNVFRFRRRTARQKCSVVSIELSDLGSNCEFAPVAIALELGQKPGLDRIP